MKVLSGDYRAWQPRTEPAAVTIGVYDGVHLGHQRVLETLRDTGLPVVVVTFRDHPIRVIAPSSAPPLLTTTEQRLELFESCGVDTVALLEFDDELRRLSAEDFVEKIVVAILRARRVAIGRGFHFGYDQLGDVALLRRMGDRFGFSVDDIEILEAGVPVRSTVIRALLEAGDVAAADRMLGRPFRLEGEVVPGDRRGRTIGFPTANLAPDPEVIVPGSGVYAVHTRFDGVEHDGVVNVGKRPTFGGTASVVEAHVLDFSGDLYEKVIAVDFIERLRAERKFDGVDDLVVAIRADIVRAREILEGT
ncbi:MAG: bifunctional riboflavin kinase/FAD synthetase [Acidimicrobiia bacterium]